VADVFVGNPLFALSLEDHERNLSENNQASKYDSLVDLGNFSAICNNYRSYPLYLVEYTLEVLPENLEYSDTSTSTLEDVEPVICDLPERPILSPIKDRKEVVHYKTNLNQRGDEPDCPSLMCRKRVLYELNSIRQDKFLEKGFLIESIESESRIQWIAYLNGPEDTPYVDGLFQIEIIFDNDYPISPPRVQFKTAIYHPCIDEQGRICLGLLNQWSPSIEVRHVLLTICCLLHDPTIEEPLMPKILEKYKYDRFTYKKIARAWTSKFAKLS